MYEDKSATELLKDFARRTNRTIEYSIQDHKASVSFYPRQYNRWRVYVPNNQQQTSYYYAYSDTKETTEWRLYSGVFIPVGLPRSMTAMVRKKDILDLWNPFTRRKYHKTGVQRFDRQTVITGNDAAQINRVFSRRHVQDLLLQAFDVDEGLRLVVNRGDLSYIPRMENQSHLGLVRTQMWILDETIIEKLFGLMEKMRQLMMR